jgi:hypothetical protein
MSKVTPSRNAGDEYRSSVLRLRDSILEQVDLVFGLAGLRDLGPAADDAVGRALEIPELAVLRISWQLIEALIDSEDADPVDLFTNVLGENVYRRARYAVFGESL